MDRSKLLEDLQQRIDALMSKTPAVDVKKNLKALLEQQLSRVNLVTHEELEAQKRVLARSREKLDALEKQLAELMAQRPTRKK